MVENPNVQRSFGLVPQVKIQAVDDKNVSFSTRSASKSGDAKEALLRTFTVPRTEVYTAPIPGAPTSVKVESGATGPLYLSLEGWKVTTPDGFGIYGANRTFGKFPNEGALPAAPLTRLIVVPTSICISGHLEGETEFFDIELLGPEAAEVQAIVWNSADYLELQLTDQGARRLRVKSRSTKVKVWPIKIVITGAPSIDPSVTGEVDLLDSEMADSVQHLAFAKRGAPITLALTPDGVDAFHVTPQAVAEQAGDLERTQPANAA
jgi:hypothetical protein